MSSRLGNKVAIVTGAASGIGFATAERFAQEGARVAAIDIDAERLTRFKDISGVARPITTLAVDISDLAAIRAAVSEIAQKYGSIDILVNSAAIFDMTTLASASEQAIDASRKINVIGTGSFLDEVAQSMIEASKPGSIINIASVSGMGVEPVETVYSSTKAEIISLSNKAALRLGKFGIRVNTVSPGPILTEASYKHMEQIGVDEETFTSRARTSTLIGRMGKPEEVANAILFLASDESSYITGSNLVIDGGFTTLLK